MSTDNKKGLEEEKSTSANLSKEDNQEGQPAKPSESGQKSPVSEEDYWKNVATQTQEKLGKVNAKVNDLETKLEDFKKSNSETSPDKVLELLREKNPNFDDLESHEQRKQVKEQIEKFKRDHKLAEQEKEIADLKFNQKLGEIISSPDYPDLQERKTDFKEFVNQPENQGKDLETLAKAFLFDSIKEKADAKPSNPGLERPTGGVKIPETKQTESLDEFQNKRKDKPMDFLRNAGQGKIKEVPKE